MPAFGRTMSGQTGSWPLNSAEAGRVAANVRRLASLRDRKGPDNSHIVKAVLGFVNAFEFWYLRVIQRAVPKFIDVIIKRVNPFVRRAEFQGLTCEQVANRLVEDWNARNFVTAGGWALEAMATHIGPRARKSSAEGIDLERYDPSTGEYHLYVLKSGLVTRNSDILKALKRNARQAEKILMQAHDRVHFVANYAVLAGKTSTTFEDGIRRPSSAQLWGELTGLPTEKAVALALAVAAEAGRLVRRDAARHLDAMKALVADYVRDRSRPNKVDWEFLARRTMHATSAWQRDDRARRKRAREVLEAKGYKWPGGKSWPKTEER